MAPHEFDSHWALSGQGQSHDRTTVQTVKSHISAVADCY